MNISASIKNSLLILGAIVGTIVVSDLVLRSIGYLPKVDHEWLLYKNTDTRVPDDNLILVKPGMLKEDYYEIDTDLDTVVTLGDSFVVGYPVKVNDSYPAVLDRLLDERGRPVNLINMGIGDSGPDQQLRLMKTYVLPRLKPDVVIWSFYANDIFDNIYRAVYDIENDALVPLDASRHWLYIRHKIYRGIPLPRTLKQDSPVLRLIFRALEIWGRHEKKYPGFPSDHAWSGEKIRLAINEMERLARTHGFRAVYILIAPQAVYLREQEPARWDKDSHIAAYGVLRRSIADHVPFIDARFRGLQVQVCGSAIETPAWSSLFAGGERDHNRLGDRHFNETGYALLADMVAVCISNGAS